MKAGLVKRDFCVITVLPLILSSLVLAASDPIVIEEVDEYYSQVDYTVINPADSSIGDIVGFVIEVDYSYYLEAYTTNGWMAQGLTATPLSATTWNLNMSANGSGASALTWRQFFGGIDYPFGDVKGVGYFVNYNEVAPNTFKFDWLFSETPYHLPILAGETRDGFYAYVDVPCSQYLLAYIDDAENGTFGGNGLPSFRGEAVPEPASAAILILGATLIASKRRR